MQTGHFASDAVRFIVAKEGFKGPFAVKILQFLQRWKTIAMIFGSKKCIKGQQPPPNSQKAAQNQPQRASVKHQESKHKLPERRSTITRKTAQKKHRPTPTMRTIEEGQIRPEKETTRLKHTAPPRKRKPNRKDTQQT
ncbi:hypothetical protein LXL04_012649 [Taraxacum kok-saghyz]